MSRRTDMHGFTLVELMITVALLAIVIGIATPSLASMIRNSQLQSKAEELKSLLAYTRSLAVTQRGGYAIYPTTDGTPWQVKRESDANIVRRMEQSDQVSIQRTALTNNKLIYRSNGTATAARFTVCLNDDPSSGYLLEVKGSGGIVLYARGKNASGTTLTTCTPS